MVLFQLGPCRQGKGRPHAFWTRGFCPSFLFKEGSVEIPSQLWLVVAMSQEPGLERWHPLDRAGTSYSGLAVLIGTLSAYGGA